MSSYKLVYDQCSDSVFFLATNVEDANSMDGLVFRVGDDGLLLYRVMDIRVVCQHSDQYNQLCVV